MANNNTTANAGDYAGSAETGQDGKESMYTDSQDDGGRQTGTDENSVKQDVRKLVGSWEWVKTACCGRMMGETFPKEGDPKRIISFDDKGTASYFSDETKEKVTSVSYSIGSLGEYQPTVKIGELQPAIFAVENDTLVLSWGYMDLQMEYYVRVK